jgi:hypothetical protein
VRGDELDLQERVVEEERRDRWRIVLHVVLLRNVLVDLGEDEAFRCSFLGKGTLLLLVRLLRRSLGSFHPRFASSNSPRSLLRTAKPFV